MIIQQLKALASQEQGLFEQGLAFREKQEESKIIAQFYNSKASPLVPQADEKFEQLKNLLRSEIEGARAKAHTAGLEAQSLVLDGMTWLTGALVTQSLDKL